MISLPSIDNSCALAYNISIVREISILCKPLLDNFGITHFTYSHFFNNGKYLDFCTDIKWQRHYIENFASENFINKYIKQVYISKAKYALWNNDPNRVCEKIFSQFIVDRCGFDIWHGFTIYKHHKNSMEAWHFATTKENDHICNFYINNIDLLEHFILYFRDKAFQYMDYSDEKKLIILRDVSPFIAADNIETKVNKNFIEDTCIKKYYLNIKDSTIYLSPKEAECIYYLSQAKSSKEIANIMRLSPRTIETHIENVKRKTGYERRSQLVTAFSQTFTHDPYVGINQWR